MAIVAICEPAVVGDRRRSRRHRLLLEITARTPDKAATTAIVHELSQTGFLVETGTPVALGDILEMQLPELTGVSARVLWSCGRYFGCEFRRPLSQAAVSAALLKAGPGKVSRDLPPGLHFERSLAPDDHAPVEPAMSARAKIGLLVAASAAIWSVIVAIALAARIWG